MKAEIPEAKLKVFRDLYPKLDIDAEFRDSTAWWVARYDTFMPAAFFADWLKKCQDKYDARHMAFKKRVRPPLPGFWEWLESRYPGYDKTVSWGYLRQIHGDIVREYERVYAATEPPLHPSSTSSNISPSATSAQSTSKGTH